MSVKPTENRPVNQQELWCAAATSRLLPSQTLLSLWNRLYGAFFACIINYGRVNHLLMFGSFLASHYFIVANPPRTIVYDAISVAFNAFCSFSSVSSSKVDSAVTYEFRALFSLPCCTNICQSLSRLVSLQNVCKAVCLLTMYCGLWLSESNPPFAFPSVVVFCVWPVDGTWPL